MDYLDPNDKLLDLERQKWAEGFCFVGGVDEAGRGPLAGPVVAAAVIFAKDTRIPAVNDSKKLTHAQRLELDMMIRETPGVEFAVAVLDSLKIDELNILRASQQAMREAAAELAMLDFLLIDGLPVPGFKVKTQAVVKGDGKCASIAAASILAKVHRDKMMFDYDRQYPAYGFAEHKGYATAAHLAALKEYGPCPIHRRNFAPVRDIIEPPPEQLELF